MGDRRMAQIVTSEGAFYIYTHWGGGKLPDVTKDAIRAARSRWGDEPYATRILVDQMTKSGRDQVTGYGLMLTPGAEDSYNNDNPSIIVDIPKQIYWDAAMPPKMMLTFTEVVDAQ